VRKYRYRILVTGELTDAAHEAFKGWTVEPAGADTAVTGDMDQAALFGVLARIEHLDLEIVEACRLAPVLGAAVDDGRAGVRQPAPP
jgi:hypothetical protein